MHHIMNKNNYQCMNQPHWEQRLLRRFIMSLYAESRVGKSTENLYSTKSTVTLFCMLHCTVTLFCFWKQCHRPCA